MDRLERLVNLLSALIDTTRPLSREDIRQRVPGYSSDDAAFRRAFERDKETLRSMGVSLITEPLDIDYPDHGDGYRIPADQYALPDPGLTREEMDALALAASSVKLRSDAANSALGKLGGGVRQTSNLAVELNDDERLPQLFSARSERRTIDFMYKGKPRSVDPYRLSFRNGHWYVNGFDHGHKDVRTYRLDRVDGAIELGNVNAFEQPQPVTQPWLPMWQLGDESPVNARILVDCEQAEFAIEQTGESCIAERRADGSVVLEFEITSREGFRHFILGFLQHAEVLGPDELRDYIVQYLRSLAEL